MGRKPAHWLVALFMIASVLTVVLVDSEPAAAGWEPVAEANVGTATVAPTFGYDVTATEEPPVISAAELQTGDGGRRQDSPAGAGAHGG